MRNLHKLTALMFGNVTDWNKLEEMQDRYLGQVLKGYCGGAFGRDGYGPKRIIAVGEAWILVRYDSTEWSDGGAIDVRAFKGYPEMEADLNEWLLEPSP